MGSRALPEGSAFKYFHAHMIVGDYMPIVKMDEKGRIQLPHEVRDAWKLRPRQPLSVRMEGETVSVTKVAKPTPDTDPVLRDILLHPLRSKRKVTKALLDKLEEEQWSQ